MRPCRRHRPRHRCGPVIGEDRRDALVGHVLDPDAGLAAEIKPDFLIGSSKGYGLARSLDVPLVRVGFPIHDRIGGQRILHVGYQGAQELYDRVVNSLMECKQKQSTVGYSYL